MQSFNADNYTLWQESKVVWRAHFQAAVLGVETVEQAIEESARNWKCSWRRATESGLILTASAARNALGFACARHRRAPRLFAPLPIRPCC